MVVLHPKKIYLVMSWIPFAIRPKFFNEKCHHTQNWKIKKMVEEKTNDELQKMEEHTESIRKKEKKRKREDKAEKEERDLRRASRKAKRMEKEELLAKVPKVNEDGIKYTKIQIKRMLKRVKRGLHPVPTEEEERERLRDEAQMRREDEAEFAGLLYQKEEENAALDENEDEEEEDQHQQEQNDEFRNDDVEGSIDASQANEQGSLKGVNEDMKSETLVSKQAKRLKPVPPDYVCQACNNSTKPAHWIYDCSMKVTVRGRNQKKKKLRGINQPDSRKLFVSGLPFDTKSADVAGLFKACGNVVTCKLIKFGDTGRCNGQAYVSFDTDEAASKALKLSGTMIDNGSDDAAKKKGGKASDAATKRKQLKLKVSKTVNRRATSIVRKRL